MRSTRKDRHKTSSEHPYIQISNLAIPTSPFQLLAGVPAAFTVDFTPHFHRVVVMMLPVSLVVGYGLYTVIAKCRWKKIPYGMIVWAVLLVEFIYFGHKYIHHSESFSPTYRNDQSEEVVEYILQERNNYDRIIVLGREKLPLYYAYATNTFEKSFIGTFGENLFLERVDDIEFVNDWCPSRLIGDEVLASDERILIIDQGDCFSHHRFTSIGELERGNSTKAFKFLIPREEE